MQNHNTDNPQNFDLLADEIVLLINSFIENPADLAMLQLVDKRLGRLAQVSLQESVYPKLILPQQKKANKEKHSHIVNPADRKLQIEAEHRKTFLANIKELEALLKTSLFKNKGLLHIPTNLTDEQTQKLILLLPYTKFTNITFPQIQNEQPNFSDGSIGTHDDPEIGRFRSILWAVLPQSDERVRLTDSDFEFLEPILHSLSVIDIDLDMISNNLPFICRAKLSSLTHLTIRCGQTPISDTTMQSLARLIANNPQIKTLTIDDPRDYAPIIFRALGESNIEDLRIHGYGIHTSEQFTAFISNLPRRLVSLKYTSRLTDFQLPQLVQALQERPIVSLDLSFNKFTDVNPLTILVQSHKLQTLKIEHVITQTPADELLRAISQPDCQLQCFSINSSPLIAETNTAELIEIVRRNHNLRSFALYNQNFRVDPEVYGHREDFIATFTGIVSALSTNYGLHYLGMGCALPASEKLIRQSKHFVERNRELHSLKKYLSSITSHEAFTKDEALDMIQRINEQAQKVISASEKNAKTYPDAHAECMEKVEDVKLELFRAVINSLYQKGLDILKQCDGSTQLSSTEKRDLLEKAIPAIANDLVNLKDFLPKELEEHIKLFCEDLIDKSKLVDDREQAAIKIQAAAKGFFARNAYAEIKSARVFVDANKDQFVVSMMAENKNGLLASFFSALAEQDYRAAKTMIDDNPFTLHVVQKLS